MKTNNTTASFDTYFDAYLISLGITDFDSLHDIKAKYGFNEKTMRQVMGLCKGYNDDAKAKASLLKNI